MIRFDTKKDYELYNSKFEEIYRLQRENKQLKEKYLNAVADYETTMSENKQLKDNWNKLKEYIKSFDTKSLHEYMEHNLADTLESILNKMQELEQGSDSNGQ